MRAARIWNERMLALLPGLVRSPARDLLCLIVNICACRAAASTKYSPSASG